MIKNFKNGFCDRCKVKSDSFRGSYFNEDMCCVACIELERKHKDYEEARRVEREEVLKGHYNFKGIGLPDDLKTNN